MTACLTGCTLRGRHVAATCPGDPCTGCMPRPVTPPATICDRCRSRLAGAINRAPALIIHLRDHVEPGSTPPGNGGTRGKPEAAPAPLNLAAMAAADDITALLVHWADWITTRRDIAAVKGVLRGDNGQCVGLLGLREPDLRVCALLLAHLDWAACTSEAGEMSPRSPPWSGPPNPGGRSKTPGSGPRSDAPTAGRSRSGSTRPQGNGCRGRSPARTTSVERGGRRMRGTGM